MTCKDCLNFKNEHYQDKNYGDCDKVENMVKGNKRVCKYYYCVYTKKDLQQMLIGE